jgi:hypothetical protein
METISYWGGWLAGISFLFSALFVTFLLVGRPMCERIRDYKAEKSFKKIIKGMNE